MMTTFTEENRYVNVRIVMYVMLIIGVLSETLIVLLPQKIVVY